MQFHFKNRGYGVIGYAFCLSAIALATAGFLFLVSSPVHAQNNGNTTLQYPSNSSSGSSYNLIDPSLSTPNYSAPYDPFNGNGVNQVIGGAPPSSSDLTPTPPTDVTKAPYTLLEPLPCLGTNISGCSGTSGSTFSSINISDFISYAYKFMLALAVVLAVFMITVGGFEYMLSGAADTKSDALKKIQNAVWGLLLALVAYLLLYTIDPNLVSPSNLSIPPISQPSAP